VCHALCQLANGFEFLRFPKLPLHGPQLGDVLGEVFDGFRLIGNGNMPEIQSYRHDPPVAIPHIEFFTRSRLRASEMRNASSTVPGFIESPDRTASVKDSSMHETGEGSLLSSDFGRGFSIMLQMPEVSSKLCYLWTKRQNNREVLLASRLAIIDPTVITAGKHLELDQRFR